MDNLREELETVKKILAASPKGMTISDVSERMGTNRNAVAKYLEVLRTAGEVDMKPFGRSKIFSLSSRVPLATALSLSSDLIALIDSDLKILDTNDQLLRFTGLSRGQIVGYALDSINADILAHPNVLLNIKDALNGKEYVHEITIIHGKDDYYFKIKILPVAPGGLQRRAAIIYENITARKKAEMALRESEARYRTVVEDQTELICRLLPDTTITFVNDAWCRFFSAPRDRVVGKKLIELMPPAYSGIFQRELGSVQPARPAVTFEGGMVMPGGKRRWLQSTYRGRFDNGGRLTEIQIVARDITERRQAEEMLRKLSRAVEDSPATVIITDTQGDIEYVNPKFTVLTGYSFDEVRGKNPRLLKSGHTTQEEYRRLWDTILAGNVWRGEFLNKKKSGELYWESAIISPILDADGQITNFVAIKEDITDRKKAEMALRESEARYRAVVEDQTDMICRLLPDTTITFVNDAWPRFYGGSVQNGLGKKLLDFIAPEVRKYFLLELEAISPEKPSRTTENMVRVPGGATPWVQFTYRGIFDDDGRLLEYQIVARDITARKKVEMALRESEARYRAVVEDHTDMIMRMQPDGTIVFVNDSWCRFLGMERSQIIGTRFLGHHGPYAAARLKDMLSRIQVENDIQFSEEAMPLPDGSRRWLQWTCRGIFDDAGRLIEYQILTRDVTGYKATEIALKESEASFRNIYDHAPIGIFRMSADDFRFLDVNPEFCRLIGYDQGELLAMTFGDITHPGDLEMCRKLTNAVIQGSGDYYQIEKRCVRKDGRVIWTRAHGRLMKSPEGKPLYFITMIADITDRVRMIDSLRVAQLSMDMAVDHIGWIDADGRIVYANDAICRVAGYTRDELLAMDIFAFVPQLHREEWPALLDMFKRKRPRRAEMIWQSRDGKRHPIEMSLSLISVGGTDYICAYARPIAEPGRAAAVLAADAIRFGAYP